MGDFSRKIRRTRAKNAGKGFGRGSAAGVPRFSRRMPEIGEKFVLAGTNWVTPTLFVLEGYTDDGRAIIRFAGDDEVQGPIVPGLPTS